MNMAQQQGGAPAAPGTRPTQFLVIAILNFVFAFLVLLAAFGFLALLTLAAKVGYKGPGVGLLWTIVIIYFVNVGLLIASGVGLIKVKKWGWLLALIYSGLSVIFTIVFAAAGGGFGFGTLVGLAYPLVVIGLLIGPKSSRDAVM